MFASAILSSVFMPSKRPITARLSAVLLAVAAASPAFAQPLTEAEVVARALDHADNLAIATAPVGDAEGRLATAQARPNPVLSVEREGADGFGGDGSDTFVRIEQAFDVSGRRGLQAQGARADLEAAQRLRDVGLAELRSAARTAYYDLVAAEAEAVALATLAEELAALEQATRQRVDAGDASQLELERVRQETLLVPTLEVEARLAIEAAEDEIYILTGIDPYSYDGAAGTLLPGDIGADGNAAAGSARIAALEAEAEAARARELAAERVTPDVTVGLGLRQTEGPADETGVLVSASVPLPIFNRNEGERRSREADARLAEARLRRERRRIEAEAARLQRQAAQLHAAAIAFEGEALASAIELRRIALVSYRAGEIGVLEAIDANRTAYETELRSISLKRRAREASIALEELIAEMN
jgi:cobalt-zinc-cadmium efflux system outer membrane protein